jgi:hypothetical protein
MSWIDFEVICILVKKVDGMKRPAAKLKDPDKFSSLV